MAEKVARLVSSTASGRKNGRGKERMARAQDSPECEWAGSPSHLACDMFCASWATDERGEVGTGLEGWIRGIHARP